MDITQIPLTDELKAVVDRQVAEGYALSPADFIADAVHAYADHLDAEREIEAMIARADADMAAGRFITIASPEDSQALREATLSRLRARLAQGSDEP